MTPVYRPQFVFGASMDAFRLIMTRYSSGAPVGDLARHFAGILDAWELSDRLAADICAEHKLETCRDWTFALSDLNHYNWCFWLVGLALALEIPDAEWKRLVALIGHDGEDELLDRIVATREPQRRIGRGVLHGKPYARLLRAIDASGQAQAELLRDFVANWYAELARKGKNELWWYAFGDEVRHPLKMGSYFGRWCLEAIAAVKAFDLDDGLCLTLEHYPAALLHRELGSERTGAGRKSWIGGIWRRLSGR